MDQKHLSGNPNPKPESRKEAANREAYYRRLFEAAKDGILVIDADTGNVLDVNPFLVETFGYPRQEIVNKAVWELGFLKKVFTDKTKLAEFRKKEYIRYEGLLLETADYKQIDVDLVGNAYDLEHQRLIQLSIRNVSERKKAESALKENEKRFRRLIEDAPIGIALSKQGTIAYVNSSYLKMFGFDKPEEVVGNSFLDQIASQSRVEVIERTLSQEQGLPLSADYTSQGLRKDGSQFPFQAFVSWVDLSDGPVVIGYFTDITERKRAEMELARLSEHQDTILAAIPDIIMEVDNNKVYTWANKAGIEFFGEDVIGREASYYFEGEQSTYSLVQPVFNGSEDNIYLESWQRRKDGQKRLLAWSCRSLKDANGMVIGAMSAANDITERKKIEGSLIQAAEEWRTTFDSINDMVSIQDRDFKILRVNAAYARALGMPDKDIIGKTCFELVHGTKEPVDSCPHQVTIRTSKPASFESHDSDKNTYAEVSTFPIFDKHHKVTGTVHIIHDITKRKKAEAEQKILRDKAEMASRLAAVGEMAAGIAHEINNPLTGVIGFSELLLERPGLPEDVKEELRIINDGSQRVSDIVRRMLTFARQVEPQRRNVSINELLDHTLELRDYVLKTSNIKVVKNYDPELPWINADPGQLQQVFLNLVVNAEFALKQTNEQGILTLKTERLEDLVRISITDNGAGISGDALTKLFQPFFTTKDPGEGTGLGLSLSHGIIQEHSGNIRAESSLGHGATFIIELPVTPAEIPLTIEVSLPEPGQAVKHARVLVIDDEPTVRSLIRTILTQGGHVVEECDDSRLVLEKLQETNFDVVLLDLRMPGMSGMALFSAISAKWPKLASRVIFITGDTSDLDTREYLATHQISFITKPFNKKTLVDKVNTLLGS